MSNVDNTINLKFTPELVYQPLELLTEYKIKEINKTHYNKLDSVNGIMPYFPDTIIKDSCLLDMINLQGKVEFLMVVTMYNEGRKKFTDTMHGVMENLKHFQEDGLDPNLVGCIIIVDGIHPFSQTFHKPDQNPYFSNFFNEDQIRERFNILDTINGIPLLENQEIAHCFSCRTNFAFEGYPELQLVFCVKQKNKRKLNSHLWFFGGFCKMINPKFVMLIDVGTKPFGKSLCALYDTLKTNDLIAGVCGEIAPMDVENSKIIVSAQVVEYTFFHIFNKALESCFGYIGVLPGAFSAYRWEAISGPPLEVDYFIPFTRPEIMNCYYSNIFSDEDRVLSLAIVSRPGTTYLLKFIHLAYAETDVPNNLIKLLSQRRRWINGSWFALIETFRNFGKIGNSHHSKLRKILFSIELINFVATIFVSWIMVGSFYFFTKLIFGEALTQVQLDFLVYFSAIELVMDFYLGILIVIFILSFGVKAGKDETAYKVISLLLDIYFIVGFFLFNYFTFSAVNQLSTYTIFILSTVIGSFVLGIIITKKLKKVLMNTVQFLLVIPIYVNIFGIYSVCNIHDCSWGYRPENMTEQELQKVTDFQHYRTKWLIIWFLSNVFFYKIMDISLADPKQGLLTVIFTLVAIIILLRFFGCIWHYFFWWFKNKNSGSKRYIALSSHAALDNENKNFLEEINDKINQSIVITPKKVSKKSELGKSMMAESKKNLRSSLLDMIEKKGKTKLGKNLHLNLTEMIKMNEIIDSASEDSEQPERSESNDSEMEEKLIKNKKNKKINKKKANLGRTVILRKCDLEESKGNESDDLEHNKSYKEIEEKKNFLNDLDISHISKSQCLSMYEFKIDDKSSLISQKSDIDHMEAMKFEFLEQRYFNREDSQESQNLIKEIKDITEKTKQHPIINKGDSYSSDSINDTQKYLGMLDSIIKNVSRSPSFQ